MWRIHACQPAERGGPAAETHKVRRHYSEPDWWQTGRIDVILDLQFRQLLYVSRGRVALPDSERSATDGGYAQDCVCTSEHCAPI